MEEWTTNSRNQVNKNQKRVLSDGAGYRWQKRVGPEKAGPPREGGEGGGVGRVTSKLLNRIHIYYSQSV